MTNTQAAAGAAAATPPELQPRTAKGHRSKQALLTASRSVFRDHGYANARVSDMAAAAGMSNGAFYRYFKDKRDVLMVLLKELSQDMYDLSRADWQPSDPVQSVYETTVRYLILYRDNADLIRAEIEAAQSDEGVLSVWRDARDMFYQRIARSLRLGMEQGVVKSNVQPELAATLLGGMTEHYAYMVYVLQEHRTLEMEQIAEQISQIWSVGVFTPPAAEKPRGRAVRPLSDAQAGRKTGRP